MFKTPRFWLQKNYLSKLLTPLSLLYKIGFYLKKNLTKTNATQIPIICIGNIVAGGAGKTPFALFLGKYLKEKNINFCYLTRGYKSKNNNVKFIEKPSQYLACEVGDEAMLLAEIGATFVAKNRFLAYQEIARKREYQAIIMDDGLQNFQLKYNIKILIIDGKIGFGNSQIIPAGPMRQSLKSIVNDIDLFIIVGADNKSIKASILRLNQQAKISFAKIKCCNLDKFTNQNIMAFCGLAYPQKFFDYIKKIGLNLIEEIAFSDHYNYNNKDLAILLQKAKLKNCKLITTKKDWVKFSEKFQKDIDYLDIEMDLEDKIYLEQLIKIN